MLAEKIKDDFAKFLAEYQTLRWLFNWQFFCINNAMFDNRTLRSLFLRIKEIVEKGLGDLFITSSSSYFFNKTDIDQHLFTNSQSQPMMYCSYEIMCNSSINLVHIFFSPRFS